MYKNKRGSNEVGGKEEKKEGRKKVKMKKTIKINKDKMKKAGRKNEESIKTNKDQIRKERRKEGKIKNV